jgi:predicted PurR-regulated permease PerM
LSPVRGARGRAEVWRSCRLSHERLNYIPILGPMTGVVIFFLVGIVTFDWPWYAFVPAGVYLLIHIAEGETITPMLLAKRFTLNPVLVIISLFLWHTVWGIPGALLAVPLLAIFKIIPTVLSR